MTKTGTLRVIFLLLMVFLFSCSYSNRVNFDPESEDFYEEARLIMSGEEKQIFHHLPDKESRQEFIQDFWKKRDPTPQTDPNEFKQEFYERIDYANDRFKEGIPGWKTDRGRIYIYFGFPDRIEQEPMLNYPEVKGYLLWVYYRFNFAVQFIDKRGDNTYTLNPYSGIYGSLSQAMELAKFGISYSNEIGTQYIDFKANFKRSAKELTVSFPVKGISFVEEDGMLMADFEFQFYVYADQKGAEKKTFIENRHFESTERELVDQEEISFTFSFDLKPGKYFFDILIIGKPDIGRTRKIFKIRI
ncbi:MAG: GWxTD domain-containing protein [Candidatus Aminicenantes bacterium]|nr:GWxTD domain-containing protein [Candidatus Aminicenantes bacterium]